MPEHQMPPNTHRDAAAMPGAQAATPSGWQLFRGEILHFLADPGPATEGDAARAFVHHTDGGLLLENGIVRRCGAWAKVAPAAPAGATWVDYSGRLILPGFVDTHIHYPQTDIIASPGRGLLDWLDRYAFPAERRFGDPAVAQEAAEFFCDELLRNGTTTALVFGTVHPQSVDALFGVALRRGLRIVAGKVMMDRNCPDFLRDTAQSSYDDSKRLIEGWHGTGRLGYAITPRFAATSTEEQLAVAGALAREFPAVPVHSHVAENTAEVALIRELYPRSRSYLDVYDHYGLLKPHSVYAHGIYLDGNDRRRMAESATALSFCPSSNLFLGSGLLDLRAVIDSGVRVGIGSDVGGGTSFSLLRTRQRRQVEGLQGRHQIAVQVGNLIGGTQGAQALGLDAQIGNFAVGKEADFIVLDPAATPLLARRMGAAQSLAERLFLWMTLGDDRAVAASHVMGTAQWERA